MKREVDKAFADAGKAVEDAGKAVEDATKFLGDIVHKSWSSFADSFRSFFGDVFSKKDDGHYCTFNSDCKGGDCDWAKCDGWEDKVKKEKEDQENKAKEEKKRLEAEKERREKEKQNLEAERQKTKTAFNKLVTDMQNTMKQRMKNACMNAESQKAFAFQVAVRHKSLVSNLEWNKATLKLERKGR